MARKSKTDEQKSSCENDDKKEESSIQEIIQKQNLKQNDELAPSEKSCEEQQENKIKPTKRVKREEIMREKMWVAS